LAKESDVIDPSRLGALRRREEQSDGRHVGELRGPARQRFVKDVSSESHGTKKERREGALLDRILPYFASYGNVKLLQGLLVRGIFKVEIVHVRKLRRS